MFGVAEILSKMTLKKESRRRLFYTFLGFRYVLPEGHGIIGFGLGFGFGI